MAKLLKVTPFQNPISGECGECAKWDSEPTTGQAAGFVSNEWAIGRTCAPPDGDHGDTGTGAGHKPSNVGWGLLLLAAIILLAAAIILPWRWFP